MSKGNTLSRYYLSIYYDTTIWVNIVKRKSNLYDNICNVENIISAFNEVCRNMKNKRKLNEFKEFKCMYVSKIYRTLINREYKVGPYNVFTIYEPKKRRIVSQGVFDKIINHLVARYILIPALLPSLIDQNVASRVDMGTKKGLEYYYKYRNICECKYKKYYILKCDISSFFASINQDILKEKIKKKIKDKDALKIVFDVIDSEENGLGIGNMTSQVLAIFYLNDMDHFIKEELKIKYYIRYQDDFLLMHPSKEYLRECLEKIRKFLVREKLSLNKKTRVYSNYDNFIFLGRTIKGRYAKYRTVKRRLKKREYLYNVGNISLMSYVGSVICYDYLKKSIR